MYACDRISVSPVENTSKYFYFFSHILYNYVHDPHPAIHRFILAVHVSIIYSVPVDTAQIYLCSQARKNDKLTVKWKKNELDNCK